MSKQRRIRGTGQGTAMTVWVSEGTKKNIQKEAKAKGMKPSGLARAVLEERFNIPNAEETAQNAVKAPRRKVLSS